MQDESTGTGIYGVAGQYDLCAANSRLSPTNTAALACNCIGCCRKCGRCRTAPWHAGTCDAVTELRRTERRIVSDEIVRMRRASTLTSSSSLTERDQQ